MKKIKVVELFAGVGGFRVGLNNANKDLFDFVWANQWEPGASNQFAYDCYVEHFGKGSCVNNDIAQEIDNVPKHDLLVGGFPCQDYSVARTGAKGIEGKKGVLWWSINSIVEKNKPKFVLLENVDRLLKSPTSQRGRDFAIILKCLDEKGYDVDWMMINAAEYGMQQKRRRTFIFAQKRRANKKFKGFSLDKEEFDNDLFFTKKFKLESVKDVKEIDLNKYKDVLSVSNDYNEGKLLNVGKMRNGHIIMSDYKPSFKGKQKTLGEILEESKVDTKFYLNDDQQMKAKATKDSKRIERTSKDGFKYNYSEGSMCFPDKLDIPARTMLTSEGTLNRSTHYVKGKMDSGIRVLTPIECERINGFPDNWTNTGMTDRNRYFCMGNALVVNLIEEFGNILDQNYNK